MTDDRRPPSLFVPSTGVPLSNIRRLIEAPELQGRVGVHLTLPTLTLYGISGCAHALGLANPRPTPQTARVIASLRGPRGSEERDEVQDILSCLAGTIPTLDGILLEVDSAWAEWALDAHRWLAERKPAGPTMYVPATPGRLSNWWRCPDAKLSGWRVTSGIWLDHVREPKEREIGPFRTMHEEGAATAARRPSLGTLHGLLASLNVSHHMAVLDARLLQGEDPDALIPLLADACQRVEDSDAARRHQQREAATSP